VRALLVVAAVLVFLAGVQLFVFPTRTAERFAWTIDPPMTAVFLGAAYWSSLALELTASRSRTWAGARIAVPTVFAFTTLTLVVTLVHLDRFHLGTEHAGATRAVTWAWIAVYAVVPVLMVVVALAQARLEGPDPPRTVPLPRPVAVVVGLLAAGLLTLGTALLVAPEDTAPLWPWALTPLTARAVGAWSVGLGVAATHALVERDARRVAPAAWAFVAFGVLQGVALARHGDDLDWSRPASWVLAAVLVVAVAVGLAVLRAAARADPAMVIDLTDAPQPARGRAATGGRGRVGHDAGA
jgi:hypothetical protein